MKYLFTYAYAGTKGGIPTSGQGSMIMTTPEKGVTEKLIYDEKNGAISIAKKSITDIDNLQLTPMGWYKFDNVGKEQNDSLEKIRKEIENQKQVHENESNVDYGVRSGLSIALKIIDKYAEQECDEDYQTDMDEAWEQAKQEPKTGHWIAVENEEMETIGYYCSECDLPMETEEKTRYCPNCGARMEGGRLKCGESLK